MKQTKFANYTYSEIEAWFTKHKEPSFRAGQLFSWVYVKKVTDPNKMSNFTKELRKKLEHAFSFTIPPVAKYQEDEDGTIKFTQQLKDDKRIETVILRHEDHNTVCISTQVGCAMGCAFCLTGKLKLRRNLEVHEIVDQVRQAAYCLPEGQTIRNIVYMGMGEPFHTYERTINSIAIFRQKQGFNFSPRRITVSTCGIVPKIYNFTSSPYKTNLAISLHVANQQKRAKLMPIAKRYLLEDLRQACFHFARRAKEPITFEYILIDSVTDSIEDAKNLVYFLRNMPAKVNLLPLNEHSSLPYKQPSEEKIVKFQQYLLKNKILTVRRVTRGNKIAAACGQLALLDKQ